MRAVRRSKFFAHENTRKSEPSPRFLTSRGRARVCPSYQVVDATFANKVDSQINRRWIPMERQLLIDRMPAAGVCYGIQPKEDFHDE
jgi:hypothetical protein